MSGSRQPHVRAHLETMAHPSRTVHLSARLSNTLAHPGLDPEAALMAKEEPIPFPARRRELALEALQPRDALAIDWWLMGLSLAEVGAWMGVGKCRVHQRIRRGIARLKAGGHAQRR